MTCPHSVPHYTIHTNLGIDRHAMNSPAQFIRANGVVIQRVEATICVFAMLDETLSESVGRHPAVKYLWKSQN